MPAKQVQAELTLGPSFRTECHVGKHVVIIDQPSTGGGGDAGPTPLEYQLVALGGCVAAIARIIAHQRHLPLRGMQISVAGDIDTDGLLGRGKGNRVGFSAIKARVKLDTDLPRPEQEKFLHEVDERCPISENLKNPSAVEINLEG